MAVPEQALGVGRLGRLGGIILPAQDSGRQWRVRC
jgi:hypothetical protein